MRPWSVFLAEILQFQDQFGSLTIPDQQPEDQEVYDERDRRTEKFLEQLSDTPVARWKDYKDFRAYRDKAGPVVLESKGRSLQALGFDELPPAGYIDGVTSKDLGSPSRLRSQLEVLFGTNVNLRICHVRADYVAGAVEDAQHLDRIPLHSTEYGKVDVDILLPDRLADLEGLRTEQYGWVAFTRRRSARCEGDLVEVYRVEGAVDDTTAAFSNGQMPNGATHLGQLSYPIDGWEYPGGALGASVKKGFDMTLLAIATSEERRPLMALRASLFAASLDGGAAPPPVSSILPSSMQAEAIVVIDTDNS
jgi:hypothetical protein